MGYVKVKKFFFQMIVSPPNSVDRADGRRIDGEDYPGALGPVRTRTRRRDRGYRLQPWRICIYRRDSVVTRRVRVRSRDDRSSSDPSSAESSYLPPVCVPGITTVKDYRYKPLSAAVVIRPHDPGAYQKLTTTNTIIIVFNNNDDNNIVLPVTGANGRDRVLRVSSTVFWVGGRWGRGRRGLIVRDDVYDDRAKSLRYKNGKISSIVVVNVSPFRITNYDYYYILRIFICTHRGFNNNVFTV